jgi:hypothetical protein
MSTPPTPDQSDFSPQELRQEQTATQSQVCQRPPEALPPTPKIVITLNQETCQNNDKH